MTGLNQGWLIARREMRERYRSRGFRISSLLMLLVAVAAVALPGLIGSTHGAQEVGLTGTMPPALTSSLSGTGRDGSPVRLHRFGNLSAGEQALRDETVDVLVVDARRLEWRGRPDPDLQSLVTGAIQVSTVLQRAADAGVDPDTVVNLLAPVPVESVQIGAAPGRSADDDIVAALLTSVLLTAIVIYGNLVLTGVVEEKSSRVVEVLLARVPAKALLGGKVVGIGLLGFGQLALTAVAALLTSMLLDSVDLPSADGGVLAWALAWFVLGYALYSMVYGALGSLASRTEDAQAVAGPLGYVLIAAFWLAFIAVSADPGGLWARLLSLFPATAPFAMPGRIALGAAAWWEPPLAATLTVAAIAGLVSLAGGVYQNAILRTGPMVRLRDVWHWKPAGTAHEPPTRPLRKMTGALVPTRTARIWSAVLATTGVLLAALVLALTRDVVWAAIALLVTFVAVRGVLQQR